MFENNASQKRGNAIALLIGIVLLAALIIIMTLM